MRGKRMNLMGGSLGLWSDESHLSFQMEEKLMFEFLTIYQIFFKKYK
jgi:hypothetical protein